MKRLFALCLLLFVFALPVLAGDTDGPPKAPPCTQCGQATTISVAAQILLWALSHRP